MAEYLAGDNPYGMATMMAWFVSRVTGSSIVCVQPADPAVRRLAEHGITAQLERPVGKVFSRAGEIMGRSLRQAVLSLRNITYYYEHKDDYLSAMAESRRIGHDLTPFLRFALPAVAIRCNTVAESIGDHNKRTLFRQFAQSLFGQLRSPRRRVLAERQLQVLESLLDSPIQDIVDLLHRTGGEYRSLRYPRRAWVRDFINLLDIGAVTIEENGTVTLNLDWPQELSESELLERYENLPSAVSANHPAMAGLSQLLNRRRQT